MAGSNFEEANKLLNIKNDLEAELENIMEEWEKCCG